MFKKPEVPYRGIFKKRILIDHRILKITKPHMALRLASMMRTCGAKGPPLMIESGVLCYTINIDKGREESIR